MYGGKLLIVIQALLLTVMAGVTIHAPVVTYLGTIWPEYTVELKAWKEIVLFIAACLTLLLIHFKKQWVAVFSDRLVQVGLGYIAIHVLVLPFTYTGLLSTVAGLMIDLRFIVMLLLCYVIARYSAGFMARLLLAVVVGAAIMLTFGLLQILVLPDDILRSIGYGKDSIRAFTTIDQNSDFIRIQSTTRGPNPLGAMMVIYGALLAAFVATNKSHQTIKVIVGVLSASLATAALLIASYSRSAWGGAIVAIGIVASQTARISKRQLVVFGSVGAVLIIVGGVQLSTTDFYSNVVLHEDPESTVVKKSNSEHLRSLLDGTERVTEEPFGAGVGSTGSASLYEGAPGPTIENQYLFIAHEAGWLGLGLFIALYLIIMQRLWKQRANWLSLGVFASGIGLAAVGVLLPVWVDETVAITWWGLAGGIIGSSYDTRTRQ